MQDHREEINREFAYKLIGFQVAIVIIVSALALLVSEDAALSGFIGGSIGVIGNAYFARSIFRPIDNKPAKKILVTFYASEISKLVIVFVLFLIAFHSVEVLRNTINALVMFLSFAATQSVNIFVPLMLKANDESTNKG